MPNPSSSVTLSRCTNVGSDTRPQPTFRPRKRSARSGSCKPESHEPNHSIKARVEVLGTEAFEEMFVASRQQFVAIAYSILRNPEDAEDAVQNAFVSGYLHLCNFEGRSAVKTWFTRVVLNAALMIRRKRRPVQLVSAPEWAPDESSKWMDGIPSPEPDPEIIWAKTEVLALIEELTAQLKPRLREAFLMYYGNDMPVSQACAMAGVSVSTFKARLFRARHEVISKSRRALARPQMERGPDRFFLGS